MRVKSLGEGRSLNISVTIYYFVLAFSIFNFGCQKASDIRPISWSSNSSSKAPDYPRNQFQLESDIVKAPGESIFKESQKIGVATVENSSLQKIENREGKLIYLKGSYKNFDNISSLAEKSIELDALKSSLIEVLKRKNRSYREAKEYFTPQLFVTMKNEKPHFYWLADFISRSGTEIYRIKMNEQKVIEDIHQVQHCFAEASTEVFPSGPKLSSLTQELLKYISNVGSLSSTKIDLSSQDGQKVSSNDGHLYFGTSDPRFDQVQAYYFIEKTLDFASNSLGVNLPFQLNVQLRLGFPDKTNAAFYYHGNIRIGEGDDVTYSHLPRDPSIVSHEVAHSIIDVLSSMSTDEDAGSLNEGFADFITAVMWQNPLMGHTAYLKGPYKRNLVNDKKFSSISGSRYADSLLLSGTFWQIQEKIGLSKSISLAIKTISRLGANPKFSDVRPAILDASMSLSFDPETHSIITEILNDRGWPQSPASI